MSQHSLTSIYRRLLIGLASLVLSRATVLVAESPAASSHETRIGFIVPFSGPLAEFGYAIQNGVQLALDERPELAALFKPIFEDSRYESTTALSAFQKILNREDTLATYVFGGPMSDTLSPIAESARHPLFSTEYDRRYTQKRAYVIRFADDAEVYAQTILSYLRARNIKKIGIIKVENQYHNTLSSALAENIAPDESATIVANVLPGERDFRTVIARLKSTPIQALGLYLSPGMQKAFLQQYQSSAPPIPLFGTDTFESRQENSGIENVVEGAIYANSVVDPAFEARYSERFGNQNQIVHAALAYEFSRLMGDVVLQFRGQMSKEDLLRSMTLVKERPSVVGTYSYQWSQKSGAHFSFPVALKQIQNGVATTRALNSGS